MNSVQQSETPPLWIALYIALYIRAKYIVFYQAISFPSVGLKRRIHISSSVPRTFNESGLRKNDSLFQQLASGLNRMEDDLVAQRTVLGDGLETTQDPDPLFIYEGLVFFTIYSFQKYVCNTFLFIMGTFCFFRISRKLQTIKFII